MINSFKMATAKHEANTGSFSAQGDGAGVTEHVESMQSTLLGDVLGWVFVDGCEFCVLWNSHPRSLFRAVLLNHAYGHSFNKHVLNIYC